METKYGDLQIEEDMRFQERTWKAERVAWVVMALIVLASALGLISEGPISKTRLGDPARLQIELQRVTHVDTPTRIHVRLATGGFFSIQFPYSYLSRVEISMVVPEPATVESAGGLVTYSFSGRQGMADIHFDLQFRRAGWAQGFVQGEQERVDFRQYVYP
jgi:hypothetical protein